jgi:hypothetical protein
MWATIGGDFHVPTTNSNCAVQLHIGKKEKIRTVLFTVATNYPDLKQEQD